MRHPRDILKGSIYVAPVKGSALSPSIVLAEVRWMRREDL